jgi:hypothetical protein
MTMTSHHDASAPPTDEDGPAAAASSAAGVPAGDVATEEAATEEAASPEELAARWEAEAPEPAGPLANAAACAVVLAVAVLGLVLSARLGIGTPSEPRAGTWPFVVSLAIGVLALVQLVAGRRGGEDGERFTRSSWLAGAGFVSLLGMVFLMPRIGFEIPGVLLCFFWMKVLGGETWRSAVVYSLLIVAAFYAIFVLALSTSIPHLF